jgi:hypothetical protein
VEVGKANDAALQFFLDDSQSEVARLSLKHTGIFVHLIFLWNTQNLEHLMEETFLHLLLFSISRFFFLL